jgi:osmoprotectant transport system ATP-binding protein
MIRFDRVTKRYPGRETDAVHDFTLEVPDGQTTVLIGPSGCGKSTSLRMVNRLIEPDEGTIVVDGEDIRTADIEKLRRHIGYAIQGVGLFPHWTVHQNVGVVPWLLKWDQPRIDARIRELLELVGLDPAEYDRKYPDELSGGEAQRVGVARALAADPPVLLMDEPFGAVDPITRDRLQAEFIAIQRRLRKTVVFVTHDIDEAVKLGDRIAIMRAGELVQYDVPERVLAYPVDDFVAGFVGTERALKRLSLAPVSEVMRPLDDDDRAGIAAALSGGGQPDPGDARFRPAVRSIPSDASLRTALAVILETGESEVPVTDPDGAPVGAVSLHGILARFGRPLE